MSRFLIGLVLLLPCARAAQAQTPATEAAVRYVQEHHARWEVSAEDVAALIAADHVYDAHTGATHVYLRQQHDGVDVWSSHVTVTVHRDGHVVHAAGTLVDDLSKRAAAKTAPQPPASAIQAGARALGLRGAPAAVLSKHTETDAPTFGGGSLSTEPIQTRLVYLLTDAGALRLTWQYDVQPPASTDWWLVHVDAATGALLDHTNWNTVDALAPAQAGGAPVLDEPPVAGKQSSGYRVFALPVESPIHGSRSFVTDPADPLASPFGWHDVDGQPGAEYTITRGNNAYTYDDALATNEPGYSPRADQLRFDYTFDPDTAPDQARDALLTNLFYWSNIAHDVFYHYGFDEAAGNFQEYNYGRGGDGGDAVLVEGMDGGSTNNANFASPPEGRPPRMQMYAFAGSTALTVLVPDSVAGTYQVSGAAFGGPLPPGGLHDTLVAALDREGSTRDACDPLANADALAGRIALADRGLCTFVTKARNVQEAGATGLILVNNVAGPPPLMADDGSGDDITIPLAMLAVQDGIALRSALPGVEVKLHHTSARRESSLDNGVIVHEYGHGVSNRLTGGPARADCLRGDEQVGEGWSDFFALLFTMRPDDTAETPRGIGTYLRGEETDGRGFRPFPYSTDRGANPVTYEDLPTLQVPHGVGYAWASMLWDVTWRLIGDYGFDPDLYGGDGGNNLAMRLVMQALKMQPCRPGFVDARDAVLAADTLLTDGANGCALWQAFAARGLGYGAEQGSVEAADDGQPTFVLPPGLNARCDSPFAGSPPAETTLPSLEAPFPSPASANWAAFRFTPSDGSRVTLALYDVLGRVVRVIHEGALTAEVPRTFTIDTGPLPAGLYVVRATGPSVSLSQTLVRL